MKVLQSLGQRSGTEGVFSYCRTKDGVLIKPISAETVQDRTIPLLQWQNLLETIHAEGAIAFRLTEIEDATSLYGLIRSVGISLPYCPYVAAILEHEGSIDHAHPRDQPMMLRAESI